MNQFLLDTHTLIWFIRGDVQLSEYVKQLILNPDHERYFSIASLWEMSIKLSMGRLKLAMPFEELITTHLAGNAIRLLPITPGHLKMLITLPFHHKDPFDRVLVAQSLVENLPLLSRDELLSSYGVKRLWKPD